MELNTKRKSVLFVQASFFIALLIIAIVGGITYKTTKNLSDATDLVVHTYKINVELEQILSYLKDAETGQRGYILTKDSLYLEPFFSGREKINNTFAELKELTRNDEVQQQNLVALSKLIDDRMSNFDKSASFLIFDSIKTEDFSEVFLEGQYMMDAIREKIASMIALERAQLSYRQKAYKSSLNLTPIFLFALILVSLALVLIAYFRTTKDVKDLKRTNQELEIFKESTNQAEIISRHGNWVYHIEQGTYDYSDNLYRLLGEQPQSFTPTTENFMSFVHPDDLEKLQEDVAKMLENEHLPFIHYRIIQKSGNIRYLKAYGQALEIDGKRKLLGTTTDVTDEIEGIKLLEERNAELERNNKELSAFNHVASHDLQEPLRKIQTFLSRLVDQEENNLSEKGTLYISRIQNAATRMRLLIDDLLQFSRTNKIEKNFETSNINLLLENAKQDLAEAISESNAEITSDNFPVMDVIPFQIQQLFLNLIGNSIKYQSKGTEPKINITYERINALEDDKLVKPKKEFYHKLEFSDNGIGFSNEYAEQIFVLFNRLHNKSDYSGTGIGLSICKKIIENHAGYIFADGVTGEGATFTVYLPIS
jgi:signal transduction histidine kinase/CHASE3 domain sensor protein